MTNKFNLPNIGFGMGLRSVHYDHVLHHDTQIDWFEVISENYMDSLGRPRKILQQVRDKYPIVFHGVTLSIAGTDPLSMDYLKQLKTLIEEIDPVWVSDHLCWTGVHGNILHDLLPVPYTEEALKHTVARVKQVQDYLERPLILENPSTYMQFKHSQIDEAEFLKELCIESDCGLLLDVNNVYVSSYNHQLNPFTYIKTLPSERIVQIHLAGHLNKGSHIVDTHDNHVIDEVWHLYDKTCEYHGSIPTMVEWDDNIPEFEVVEAEVLKAKNKSLRTAKLFEAEISTPTSNNEKLALVKSFENLQETMLQGDIQECAPKTWVKEKANMSIEEQLSVYIEGYRLRLYDVVEEDYPALKTYLGHQLLEETLYAYIERTPPTHYNLNVYCQNFAKDIKQNEFLLKTHPAAADLARFESESSIVFDLEAQEPLSVEELQNLSEDDFAKLSLKLLSSSRIIEFAYQITEIIESVKENKSYGKVNKEKNKILIYQSDYNSLYLPLEDDEAILLDELNQADSINDAFASWLSKETVHSDNIAEKIQSWFKRWGEAACLKRA